MLRRLLIANRGEIACRIIRSARRMGMETVAVYSQADANAMHVALADQAVAIGPAAARDSYLRIDNLIAAARSSGADCVHPGYGFLSENAEFAQACADAGLKFVGPSVEAIRVMGSKIDAKLHMVAAGVPVVPGYLDAQDDAALRAGAARIGYPVLIKASAGGGGRGMRIVNAEPELADALASARREAAAAFGDGSVLIERYLDRPRHVEVQLLADAHGHCVAVFERDCSVQRRYQKVVEEAPAPGLSEQLRGELALRAVRAAQAINYEGVGTVEFIVQGDEAYFMEMNTRLQVEHPVTEQITGLDLVEWQLRVARGEPLTFVQQDLRMHGHAIEVRVYAENPGKGFLPSSGRLSRLRLPATREGIRVDSGVREGDTVSTFYDAMIAKVISWGRDRNEAIDRLLAGLRDTEIVGVDTNVAFLCRILDHAAFRAGGVDTGFIAEQGDALLPAAVPAAAALDAVLALAAVARAQLPARVAAPAAQPGNAVAQDGFRMNLPRQFHYRLQVDDAVHSVQLTDDRQQLSASIDGRSVALSALQWRADRLQAQVAGGAMIARSFEQGGVQVLRVRPAFGGDEISKTLTSADEHSRAASLGSTGSGVVRAPLPGAVLSVAVQVGDTVRAGDALLVIEAMKMEHTLKANASGVVQELNVSVGGRVQDGDVVVVIAAQAAPAN